MLMHDTPINVLTLLDRCRHWKISGYGKRASFTAWTSNSGAAAHVTVRRKAGERVDQMVMRGIDELGRRLREGMPKARPELVARRKLRATASPSKYAN